MHCPHCHIQTSITPAMTEYKHASAYGEAIPTPAAWRQDRTMQWWIGICNSCSGPVLTLNNGDTVWPYPMPSATASEIPEDIRNNLVEAKKCASVEAWRAAVTMCRRAIQMSCIQKGANPRDTLVLQINHLKDNSIITADLHDWATVVRWVGNDGAHPGGTEPDKGDAMTMIDLAEQFLHVLYVAPAKAAAHRAKIGK